jgi:hypothetical protein
MERLTQLSILAKARRCTSDQSIYIQCNKCRELFDLPGETKVTGGRSLRIQVISFYISFTHAKLRLRVRQYILEMILIIYITRYIHDIFEYLFKA